MRLICSPCGWVEREHYQVGGWADVIRVDGGWWQIWKCSECQGPRTIIRPVIPGQQTAVR